MYSVIRSARTRVFALYSTGRGDTLWVGNIPYNVTAEELQDHCEAHVAGVHSAKLPRLNEGERPKGYGFVRFNSEDEAADALDKLSATSLGGRKVVANYATNNRSSWSGDREKE